MPAESAAHVRPRRVLLVEDDPLQARGLLRLLGHRGFEAQGAPTVAAALAAVAARPPYDVIVSDLGLPDGSGEALAERLRRPLFLSFSGAAGWPRWFDGAVRKPDVAALLDLLQRPRWTVVVKESGEGAYLCRCQETGHLGRGASPAAALRRLAAAIEAAATAHAED